MKCQDNMSKPPNLLVRCIEMLSNKSYPDEQKNRRRQLKRIVINTIKELKERKTNMNKHLYRLN